MLPNSLSVARIGDAPVDLDSFFRTRAEDISSAWEDTCNAMRQIVWFGLLLVDTKDRGKQTGVIPHGEFGPWIEKNCPQVSYRTARQYMQIAVLVTNHLQIGIGCHFDNIPLHQVLHLPSTVLNKEAVEVRDKIFNLVDGKSQQFLLDFRESPSGELPGGFRPLKSQLSEWLQKKHPDLAGTAFAELPDDIQTAFKKSIAGKPKPIDPKKAEAAETAQNRDHMEDTFGAMALMENLAFASTLKKTEHEEIIAHCVKLATFYRSLKSGEGRGARGEKGTR